MGKVTMNIAKKIEREGKNFITFYRYNGKGVYIGSYNLAGDSRSQITKTGLDNLIEFLGQGCTIDTFPFNLVPKSVIDQIEQLKLAYNKFPTREQSQPQTTQ